MPAYPNYAIVGQFGAGKTTLAERFVERGWTRVSLAGRLKEWAQVVYGEGKPIAKDEKYWVTLNDQTTRAISGRQLLQEFGQSVKALDRDFWIKALLSDLDDQLYGQGPFVLDDCRFVYEATALRKEDFLIVRVETPEEVRMDRYKALYGRYPTDVELNHPSETEVLNIVPDITVPGVGDPIVNANLVQYAAHRLLT